MNSVAENIDSLGKHLLGSTLLGPHLVQPVITVCVCVLECKRRLRTCAYNSLFRYQPGPHSATKIVRNERGFSVYENLLVNVYKLRERRLYDGASRLEELVEKLAANDEDLSTETKAVLQLLLLLAGSEETVAEVPIGHKPLRLPISTHVNKNKVRLPGGPVFYGDSCQLHDIQLNGYPHYSRELFECPGNRADRMGQQHNLDTSVFPMEPGRNLHGHDLFLVKV
ncbi:uncharacterized protein LOC117122778 [Anneissia japonica]|uniref:uncharacterized protein LOC117122778 n=1 Tax=Anneissia japonica TaxID=1529436 RepID=UPI0014259F44|nr:uncharacterized protein LOC117122778 [Anneissia japonica]